MTLSAPDCACPAGHAAHRPQASRSVAAIGRRAHCRSDCRSSGDPYTELQVFNLDAFLTVSLPIPEPLIQARRALRERLHAVRDGFFAERGPVAQASLASHLRGVLAKLLPERLGLYWPLRSEFNAAVACLDDINLESIALALPYAARTPTLMHYREWDRAEPRLRDECGIPTADGPPVEPDVVLVPCLGFTPQGFRLGYGGGYFDRWLAAHPQVTAVGLAWSVTELTEADLSPQAHDQALMLIVTEQGVV
jgi:5,10-methenyltetrahydrofolate synthetase